MSEHIRLASTGRRSSLVSYRPSSGPNARRNSVVTRFHVNELQLAHVVEGCIGGRFPGRHRLRVGRWTNYIRLVHLSGGGHRGRRPGEEAAQDKYDNDDDKSSRAGKDDQQQVAVFLKRACTRARAVDVEPT